MAFLCMAFFTDTQSAGRHIHTICTPYTIHKHRVDVDIDRGCNETWHLHAL